MTYGNEGETFVSYRDYLSSLTVRGSFAFDTTV
jgi:hypothetical protein